MLKEKIYKLRTAAKLSQEEFAETFNVSRQSVHRWESGSATPELSKLIEIAHRFSISLDYLILDRDDRTVQGLISSIPVPDYEQHIYSNEYNIDFEYGESFEEGLDIAAYKDLFAAVSKLPKGEMKIRLSDILFEITATAPIREDYKYIEPNELEQIQNLRKEYIVKSSNEQLPNSLESRIHGAWMGRVCGCLLGKPIEGRTTSQIKSFLKQTNNFPMTRYVYSYDDNGELLHKLGMTLGGCYADQIHGMPGDDDTTYTVLSQKIIEKYGRDFTPQDVANTWIDSQPIFYYCTAENVAYRNFIKGYKPPHSARHKNPWREMIGAQIRGDYFGYINPGNPEKAAEMAWRDACISHVKNGIYGEMFVAAMTATAVVTDNRLDIVKSGIAQIPHTSRLYEEITRIIDDYENGVSQRNCLKGIYARYDEVPYYGWLHTNSNAALVAMSILYGEGDFSRSICMAVESGFDTDCNGATVGSIVGMLCGIENIPEYWTKPIEDTLGTSIFGVGKVKISDCVKKTIEHIKG